MDDQVGKLIEPKPIAFSFDTPGWYVVGGLVFLLLLWIIYLLIKYYQSNLYRKHALQFLTNTESKLSEKKAFGELVYETQMLIKRIAMKRYGRKKVSGLRHDEWTSFINTTWREKSFDNEDEELLSQNIYMPLQHITAYQATAFTRKARRWVKKHKKHL